MTISAATGEGLEALRDRISDGFEESLRQVELLFPYSEGGTLAELHELAGDLERSDRADGVLVKARIPAALTHRFADFALNGAGSLPHPDGTARRRSTLPRWTYGSGFLETMHGFRAARTTGTPASTCTPQSPRRSRRESGPASAPGSRSRSPPATLAWCCHARGWPPAHGIALVNSPGLIDSGYRGEVRILLLEHRS